MNGKNLDNNEFDCQEKMSALEAEIKDLREAFAVFAGYSYHNDIVGKIKNLNFCLSRINMGMETGGLLDGLYEITHD